MLLEENSNYCKPPLSEKEVTSIFDSVSKYERPDINQKNKITSQTHIKSNISTYNLTDAGNAERFAKEHGGFVRYCWDWQKWLVFDGKRWNAMTGEAVVLNLMIKTIRNIIDEAKYTDSKEKRREILDWSQYSEQYHRLQAALAIARTLKPVVSYSRDFDQNLFLFNCQNGVINLETGDIEKYDPKHMITKLCPVKFNPDAGLKLWNEFLDTVTQKDKELQRFLQMAIGYSLTGDIGEEKLFFIHSPTATGKSTFLEAIKSTLGEYAQTADFETFLKKTFNGGIRNDIANLVGARFVVSIEVEEGRKLAEGLVKTLTGGDTVRARFLYKESFEFMPQFKLWLAANQAPHINADDSAIWRRILRVPFEYHIAKEDRNPELKKNS